MEEMMQLMVEKLKLTYDMHSSLLENVEVMLHEKVNKNL